MINTPTQKLPLWIFLSTMLLSLVATFFSKSFLSIEAAAASPGAVKALQISFSAILGLLLAAMTWPAFFLVFAPVRLLTRSVVVVAWLAVLSVTWQLGNRFSTVTIEAFNSSFTRLIPMYVLGCCIPLSILKLTGRWNWTNSDHRENDSQFTIRSLIITTVLVAFACLFFRSEFAFAASGLIALGVVVALVSMPLNVYIMKSNSPYLRWLIATAFAYCFVYIGFYLIFIANFTFPLIQYPTQFSAGFAMFVAVLLSLPTLGRATGWQLVPAGRSAG